MSLEIDMHKTQKAINSIAFRVYRRTHALGAHSEQLDDIKQELWVGFCKARDTYDPTTGVPFLAYLRRGLMLHINRYVESKFERFHDQTVALSLDATVNTGTSETAPLHEVIPDNTDIETDVLNKLVLEKLQEILSPEARSVLTLLVDPPEEVVEQLQMLHDKKDHANNLGVRCVASSNRLTFSMIFDMLGYSRPDRENVLAELEQKSVRLGQKRSSLNLYQPKSNGRRGR